LRRFIFETRSWNKSLGRYCYSRPDWGVVKHGNCRYQKSAFSYKKIYLILVGHAKKFGSLGQCATSVLHAVSCGVIMKQCSEGISYSACMTSAKFFVVLRDVIHCTERHISSTSRGKNTVCRGVVLK